MFAVLTDSGKNYLQLLDEDCTFSSLRIVVGFPKKIIGSLITMKVWVNHPHRMLKKKTVCNDKRIKVTALEAEGSRCL